MSSLENSPEITNSSKLELGSHTLASWSQATIVGGSIAASLSRVAQHTELGSLAHTHTLIGLVIVLILTLSLPLMPITITAVNAPTMQVITSTSLFNIMLSSKATSLQNIAWIRVRFDGYQELFVEAGTRGFETVEIFRVDYNKGAGIPVAEEKAGHLATFWSVENKGYRGIA